MLIRMQFVVSIDATFTCLAWPSDTKRAGMRLTHEPLESIGYGSEAVAIADLDRWLAAFPNISECELIVYGDNSCCPISIL